MRTVVRRFMPSLVGTALFGGCGSVDAPSVIPIPDGSFIYALAPLALSYEGVDSTAGNHFGFTWLSAETFFGSNCLAFLPRTPTDSVGTFVFAVLGQNVGRVERRDGSTVIDTVTGFFLAPQPPGTHGSYIVDSNGNLTLNWADGARNRYFAAAASLRLTSDSVEAVADLRARGDSIRDQWHVLWLSSPSCP